MNGTYGSCNQVAVPSTGQLALDIMCGEWGASRCSAKKWFSFMGTKEGNSFVPFQINYIAHQNNNDSTFVPLKPRVVPCSEKLDVSTGRGGKWFSNQERRLTTFSPAGKYMKDKLPLTLATSCESVDV